MKKFIVSLLCFIMLSFNVMADEGIEKVKIYTNKLIDNAITKIFNKNITTDNERIVPFRKIVNENFDFDYITNFVLGVYRRGVTEVQKKAFVKQFEELNVYSFVKKFDGYGDQKIDLVDVVLGKKKGQYFVNTKVRGKNSGDKDFDLDWRLIQVGDSYKIIDVIVEGVSMAMSYRNEYSPILKDASDDGEIPVEVLTIKIEDKVIKLKLAS